MALINTKKRKLAEDTHGIKKSQKQHHSDLVPLSSTDHQFEARPVKKVARQERASGKASSTSADQAPAVKSTRVGYTTKIAQKQKALSPEFSSLDEGEVSIADPTNADTDLALKVASITALSSASDEALGNGDRSEVEDSAEGGDDDDDEEEEDDKDDDNPSPVDTFSSDVEDYSSEDEGDESGIKDEITRASRLKAPAKVQARLQKNRVASDSESTSSSVGTSEWGSDAAFDSDSEPHPDSQKREIVKSDDPNAFATSMSKILGYKLSRTQRANPILARSADAKAADEALADIKLEKKARAEMRREKVEKAGCEPWVDDLLRGVHGEGVGDAANGNKELENLSTVSAYQQREKELRKTAQKGVIKMFNAFTHVREKTAEAQGPLGNRAKKEKATEMTKEGWLEFVGQGKKEKNAELKKEAELEEKPKIVREDQNEKKVQSDEA